MLLAIDIGNTQTAVGLYEGEDLVGHWRLTTGVDRTEDETRLWLRSLLEMEGFSTDDVHGVSLSSVVPAVTSAFRGFGDRVVRGHVVVVEPGTRTGMPILIDNPREVGADRVVNAVAARERYGAPVIVVDFGTSTNFDVVGVDGAYLGGAIARVSPSPPTPSLRVPLPCDALSSSPLVPQSGKGQLRPFRAGPSSATPDSSME